MKKAFVVVLALVLLVVVACVVAVELPRYLMLHGAGLVP